MAISRVGIIGFGTVAKTHVKAIEATGAKVICVSDIKDESELSIPEGTKYYRDFEEMLSKEKLDVVHICLPHYLHFSVSEAVVSKGIPVICEKPIAMTPKQVEEMSLLGERYGVPVLAVMQNRWNKTFRTLKEELQSNRHGKLVSIKAVALWSRSEGYYKAAPWRGIMKYAGGGCMINQAIHTIDQMIQIGGEVESVKGTVSNMLDLGIEVEDTATASIFFKSGARGLLMASNAHAVNSTIELEAVTEKTIFTIKDYKLYVAPREDELKKRVIAEDDLVTGEKSYYGAGHKALISDYYKYLSGDESVNVVRVGDAGRVIKVIDMVRTSSKEGRRIDWEEKR